MKKLNRIRKKAFTLIEMLIVVIIIGVLMYALLWNKGGADKDMMLQQKMDLLAKSYNKCVMDVDNAGGTIDKLQSATVKLFGGNSVNPDDTALSYLAKKPKWWKYDEAVFFNELGLSGVCQDFLDNLNNNLANKWTTYSWYIPTAVSSVPVSQYVDPDYGGFLVCATTSDKKYGEFSVTNSKYYTCSILSLDGSKSVWEKSTLIRAFGSKTKASDAGISVSTSN